MRSKIRPAKRKYSKGEWQPYFVWFPMRVYLGPHQAGYERPSQWVWLEYVERIHQSYTTVSDDKLYKLDGGWNYRIIKKDESPCSSDEEPTGE